jgi:hypothetical protein
MRADEYTDSHLQNGGTSCVELSGIRFKLFVPDLHIQHYFEIEYLVSLSNAALAHTCFAYHVEKQGTSAYTPMVAIFCLMQAFIASWLTNSSQQFMTLITSLY